MTASQRFALRGPAFRKAGILFYVGCSFACYRRAARRLGRPEYGIIVDGKAKEVILLGESAPVAGNRFDPTCLTRAEFWRRFTTA